MLRFCANITPVSEAIVPAEESEGADPAPSWTSEPKTLKELLDDYIVECKFSARHPGTSLYLTVASNRQGGEVDIVEGQKYKLFLVPWRILMIKQINQRIVYYT